jgi:hypothetical protein
LLVLGDEYKCKRSSYHGDGQRARVACDEKEPAEP